MTTASAGRANDPVPLIAEKALWIRRRSFQMVYEAQIGHPGGDFSAADILAALYFGVLRHDPHILWTIMIMLGWVGGVMMQIIAGAIARRRT